MSQAGQAACPDLRATIAAAADRPLSGDTAAMAAHLANGPGVLAVLFYGNLMRDAAGGGLLDFYVLTESDRAYHGRGIAALANRVLPPNVYHVELPRPGGSVAAKVAVMTLSAFRARMRPLSWDTTLWARFSQPVVLARVRDEAARDGVADALASAAEAGGWWAARLAPAGSGWRAAWGALYARTYGAELRVEGTGRATAILDAHPEHFDALFAATVAPQMPVADGERRRAERQWRRRRLVGKLLNAARLTKAAATFRGGLAYALSKVERHGGRPVELSAWQRRWPVLAAPFVFLRLLWERRLR